MRLGKFYGQDDTYIVFKFEKTTEISKVKNSEVNLLNSICRKLGFPTETAKQVLQWVTDLIKLNKDRNQMTELLKDIKPVFVLK